MSTPTLSKSKVIIGYVGWWVIWIIEQTYVLHQYGFDWNTSLKDAAVTQLVFALAGYTMNTSMHSHQPGPRQWAYFITWSIALTAICIFIQRQCLAQLLGSTTSYLEFLDHSLFIRAAFGWLMIMLIAVLTWAWVYVSDRQESEDRKNDAIRLAREAELNNLRQQLQPHFLFNSLNSISALIGVRPEEARKMIQQLSDFLRGTIRKDDHAFVSLEEELSHLQLYLEIEKVRFGHRLNTKIEFANDMLPMKLPSLLLQPVVENAIKFGLYDTTGEITITISARNEKGMLELEVKNPYDAATASPKTGTGFGLPSVQRRLDLLFMRNDLLITSQEAGIFTTVIKIPQRA